MILNVLAETSAIKQQQQKKITQLLTLSHVSFLGTIFPVYPISTSFLVPVIVFSV